jgi:hypothetical protein
MEEEQTIQCQTETRLNDKIIYNLCYCMSIKNVEHFTWLDIWPTVVILWYIDVSILFKEWAI